jgi:DeoR family suf operon transcriptional repressor
MGAHAEAPTRETTLTLLLRQGELSAAHLAEQLGISVQAMRRHLRSLEDDGLVESKPVPVGPGRPSNLWCLTSRGRQHFPDGSEHFALGLLHSMAATLSPEAMASLLSKQALEKASRYRQRVGSGPLRERMATLADLRRQEGYVTELTRDPEGKGWLLSEFHCSVQRIAEEYPAVCDQELQLIRHTFPDCRVERVHWRLEKGHSCGFRITPDHG